MLSTGAATTKPALQTYDHNDLCRQPGAKRSLRKAQARLLKQGQTWYKGRFYRHNFCPQIGVWPRRRPRIQVESRRGQRARLRVLSLNVGALSTFLWQEFREALPSLPHDVVFLEETHWSEASQFAVNQWTVVQSSTSESGWWSDKKK